MLIRLDGDTEPLGWVTGVAKDETETIRLAASGFRLMKVTRTLPARDGKDVDAQRIGDVPANTMVRVMDTVTMSDKSEKVCASTHPPRACVWHQPAFCDISLPIVPRLARQLTHRASWTHVFVFARISSSVVRHTLAVMSTALQLRWDGSHFSNQAQNKMAVTSTTLLRCLQSS